MTRKRTPRLPCFGGRRLSPLPPPESVNIEPLCSVGFAFGRIASCLAVFFCACAGIPRTVLQSYTAWSRDFVAALNQDATRLSPFVSIGGLRWTRRCLALLGAYLLAQHTQIEEFSELTYKSQTLATHKLQKARDRISDQLAAMWDELCRLESAPGLWPHYGRSMATEIRAIEQALARMEIRLPQARRGRKALHRGIMRLCLWMTVLACGHRPPGQSTPSSLVGRVAMNAFGWILGPAEDPGVQSVLRWVWAAQWASGARHTIRTEKALRDIYDEPYGRPVWQQVLDHRRRMGGRQPSLTNENL